MGNKRSHTKSYIPYMKWSKKTTLTINPITFEHWDIPTQWAIISEIFLWRYYQSIIFISIMQCELNEFAVKSLSLVGIIIGGILIESLKKKKSISTDIFLELFIQKFYVFDTKDVQSNWLNQSSNVICHLIKNG